MIKPFKNGLSFALVFAAVGAIVVACGGGEPAPQTPAGAGSAAPTDSAAPATTASVATPNGGAPKAWKDMNHGERLAFMSHDVLPKMKTEFSAWDPKYASMNCATCHGDGAKDGTFKMPNAKLPVLPANPDGFKKLMTDKPEAFKFMATKVVPHMAEMLGEQPFDMQTGKGFGCGECHVMQK